MNGFEGGKYNLSVTAFEVDDGDIGLFMYQIDKGWRKVFDKQKEGDPAKKFQATRPFAIEQDSLKTIVPQANNEVNQKFSRRKQSETEALQEQNKKLQEDVDRLKVAYEDTSSHAMTEKEITAVQKIGRVSVNAFTSQDIQATERLARRYWSEMGTKSPFFRAWFGDWRKNDRTTVLIANQKGDTRGMQHNDDTGWDIHVSGKVFNESRHRGPKNQAALPYLPYINDIVRKAVLLDSYGIGTGKEKSSNSLLMHSLYAVADIGNGPEVLKLYVEEMNDPNAAETAKRAYQLQNIEKQQLGVQGSGNVPSPIRPAATIANVADLFAAVKQYDSAFNPNPPSAIVNKDNAEMQEWEII